MKEVILKISLYNQLLIEAVRDQQGSGKFLTLITIDGTDLQPNVVYDVELADYAVFNALGAFPQVFLVRASELTSIVRPSRALERGSITVLPSVDEVMPDPFGTEELDEFLTPSQADEDRVIWSMDCDDAQSKLASLQGPMFKIVAERSSESIAEILVNWLNQHNINWTRDIQRATLDIHNGKPRMAMNPEWVVNIKPLSTLIYSLSSLLCSHRQYLLKRLDWDDYTH